MLDPTPTVKVVPSSNVTGNQLLALVPQRGGIPAYTRRQGYESKHLPTRRSVLSDRETLRALAGSIAIRRWPEIKTSGAKLSVRTSLSEVESSRGCLMVRKRSPKGGALRMGTNRSGFDVGLGMATAIKVIPVIKTKEYYI